MKKEPDTIPIETKESFVVFIDILGFSQLIKKDNGSGKELIKVKLAVEKANALIETRKKEKDSKYAFWFKEFQIQSFSDCFCISIPLKFDGNSKNYRQNLVAFYAWIHVFYIEMLMSGYLCRGGIAQDWHYYNDKLIFSQGLVNAYKIESTKATYPIIMLDQTLFDKIKEDCMDQTEYAPYMFSHDMAGRVFFNPFNYSVVDEMYFRNYNTAEITYRDSNIIDKALKILNAKIEKHRGKPEVEKYIWLKEYALFVKDNHFSDKFGHGFPS